MTTLGLTGTIDTARAEVAELDNVTHAVVGAGVFATWAAVNQADVHTPLATAAAITAITGSEAPDLDILSRIFGGPVRYLQQHRMLSHSLPFSFLWALVIALILSIWQPGHFWLWFGLAWVNVAIHVALDVCTTYGTLALWPFSKRRYALNALFIVDAVLLGLGALGATAVRLVNSYQVIWWFDSIAIAYIALRIAISVRLRTAIQAQFPQTALVSVTPTPVPWCWGFSAEEPNRITLGRIASGGEAKPEAVLRVPDPTPAFRFAATTHVGRAFIDFARHLVWREEPLADGVRLRFAEALYRYGNVLPFSAMVTVRKSADGSFEVVDEGIRGQVTDLAAFAQDVAHSGDHVVQQMHIPLPKRR